jgi:hypothetical protein
MALPDENTSADSIVIPATSIRLKFTLILMFPIMSPPSLNCSDLAEGLLWTNKTTKVLFVL